MTWKNLLHFLLRLSVLEWQDVLINRSCF